MTYDKLRGNLMAYEQHNINWYNKDDKKKIVAFTIEISDTSEEENENQDDLMTLINHGVREMLRQRR